jgi:hypothetical protein
MRALPLMARAGAGTLPKAERAAMISAYVKLRTYGLFSPIYDPPPSMRKNMSMTLALV